jgi:hypothetical protein
MTMASSNDSAATAVTAGTYLDLPSSLASASPIPELVQSTRSTYSPFNSGILSFQCKNTPRIENALTELTVTQAALITSTLSYAPTTQQLMPHNPSVPTKHATPALYTDTLPTCPYSSNYTALHALPSQNAASVATVTDEQHWPQASTSFHMPVKNMISTPSQHQFIPSTTAHDLPKKNNQGHVMAMNPMPANVPQIDFTSPMNELNRSIPAGYHQPPQMQTAAVHYDCNQLSLYPIQYKDNTMLSFSSSASNTIPQLFPVAMALTPSQKSCTSSKMQFHGVNETDAHGQSFGTMTTSICNEQDGREVINCFGNTHSVYGSTCPYSQAETGHFNLNSPQPGPSPNMTSVSLEGQNSLNSFISHIHAIPTDTSINEMSTYHCQWRGCTEEFHDPAVLMHHVSEEHIGRRALGHLNLRCEWGDCEVTARKRDHIISHIRLHIPYWPLACKVSFLFVEQY